MNEIVLAWLPAVPLLVVALALLVAPAGLLVAQSVLNDSGSFTLDNWVKTFGNRNDQRAIQTSVSLGVLSASVAVIVGTPVAWTISRMLPSRRALWLALLNVAANFGGIGLGFAYLATLGAVGMVTLTLTALGLGYEPPSPASFTGLALGYQYTNIPLFVLLTIPAMGILREDWWEAAQTAAASRIQFWRHIGIPVLLPFIAGGWLLIFTWSIGIYGLAYALAGQAGATDVRIITLQIGNTLQASVFGQQRAAVLAVVLMLMATASLLTYRALLRRALKWF
ncbi:MAG TPA: ABC transporter permease subunit [Candidatus Limnocylindria bacterium]|nr:ABC transporter permease subunit [Candidatus Limnocylindria bacterium]